PFFIDNIPRPGQTKPQEAILDSSGADPFEYYTDMLKIGLAGGITVAEQKDATFDVVDHAESVPQTAKTLLPAVNSS
ncbi:MAG: hypothetical protein M1819_000773, partial [Sarea resinae]